MDNQAQFQSPSSISASASNSATTMADSPINGIISNNIINNKELSFKKERKFNVDQIIEKGKLKEGNELITYMCNIMHEKKRNILELLFKELGKEYLLSMLEKTLNIENNGGLFKEKCKYEKKNGNENSNSIISNTGGPGVNEKKTTGGIFFTLIKKDPEAKAILNRASKMDWKESKQRKKVYKLMDKLNI